MASVADFVADHVAAHASCMLDSETIGRLAVAAVRFYSGWGCIASMVANEESAVTIDTELSLSEWGVVGPLFRLYVEKEQAVQMEASQVMGITVFGRNSSEIASEIATAESEIPVKAFSYGIITV